MQRDRSPGRATTLRVRKVDGAMHVEITRGHNEILAFVFDYHDGPISHDGFASTTQYGVFIAFTVDFDIVNFGKFKAV